MSYKDDIKRIANALEKMAEPIELEQVPENSEPVCPYCQAQNPQVLLDANAAATVSLSGLMGFTLEATCLSCKKTIIINPIGVALEVKQ
jgi:hypothetical protein